MSAKKLLPKKLLPGDTIGIATPSSPVDKESLSVGISVLESLGFRVCYDDKIFSKNGYLAGTDQERADRLLELFLDSEIKAIWCARGGYGAMRILPYLDYEMIRKKPKLVIGFSDVTALLCAFFTQCGLAAIHGPLITTVTTETACAIQSISELVSGKTYQIISESAGIIRNGQASGVVIGGNLSTLCHLLGTPYCPDFKDKILILEDKGEACYRIDRMLTQMRLAGCFQSLKGLVLGTFEECGPMDDIVALTDELFRTYQFPIIAGFQIGHGTENIAFPIGIEAVLDADKKVLTYRCPVVL